LKREISRFDFFLLNQKDLQEAGNYVLIIDEINRGNVSAILGELISLLESDKRAGRSAELKAVLPYSRERFTVPPNLYLLGTMNTADRSISSLDTALRRRFVFEELLPRAELLEAETAKEANTEVAEDAGGYRAASDWPDLARMLAMINRRLELMLDREHTIGHAYLMGIQAEEQKIKRLRQVFYKQLIPLLQEYFYDDFDKIVRIIGPAFFDERREDPSLFFHGTPDDFGWQDGFSQKKNYVLRPLSDRDFLKAVRQIYEPLSA
jgi:5-methylcytosine-specific restriction protein B